MMQNSVIASNNSEDLVWLLHDKFVKIIGIQIENYMLP